MATMDDEEIQKQRRKMAEGLGAPDAVEAA